MKTCPFPREITEKGAQSLRLKMRSAELHSKEATDVTPCSRLQQDYSHLGVCLVYKSHRHGKDIPRGCTITRSYDFYEFKPFSMLR